MKHFILTVLTFAAATSFGQLTVEDAKSWATEHGYALSPKFEVDMGVKDHAAPAIVTRDGGFAIIGDYTIDQTKGVKVIVLNEDKQIVFARRVVSIIAVLILLIRAWASGKPSFSQFEIERFCIKSWPCVCAVW